MMQFWILRYRCWRDYERRINYINPVIYKSAENLFVISSATKILVFLLFSWSHRKPSTRREPIIKTQCVKRWPSLLLLSQAWMVVPSVYCSSMTSCLIIKHTRLERQHLLHAIGSLFVFFVECPSSIHFYFWQTWLFFYQNVNTTYTNQQYFHSALDIQNVKRKNQWSRKKQLSRRNVKKTSGIHWILHPHTSSHPRFSTCGSIF